MKTKQNKDVIKFFRSKGLTSQESIVAEAVCRGLSNKQIADALDLSSITIKFHLTSVYKKLKLKNRTRLVLYLGDLFFRNYVSKVEFIINQPII